MIKIIQKTELNELSNYISPLLFNHINMWQVNRFECYEKENLISFDWYDIGKDIPISKIIIYHSGEHLFFICEENHSYNTTMQFIDATLTNSKALYHFFNSLIANDITYLDEIEERITKTEDELLTTSKSEYSQVIIDFRKELLKLKKYYEQLNQVFLSLLENENELFHKDELRYFKILNNKIDHLYLQVLNLRDYVTQVREAYQAQIDIEQNHLMKVFTIIAAYFLPLTLIVGWYGMNVKMPEFAWDYGYLFVIVLSISVIIFCLVLFKRKKWF